MSETEGRQYRVEVPVQWEGSGAWEKIERLNATPISDAASSGAARRTTP
jgi:hypothetical protein